MLQQCFKIKLQSDKSKEFIQCWQSFTQHIKDMEGTSCSIKEQDKNNYELIFNFEKETQLNSFQQNEWYTFLMGGIQTLGQTFETKIRKIE